MKPRDIQTTKKQTKAEFSCASCFSWSFRNCEPVNAYEIGLNSMLYKSMNPESRARRICRLDLALFCTVLVAMAWLSPGFVLAQDEDVPVAAKEVEPEAEVVEVAAAAAVGMFQMDVSKMAAAKRFQLTQVFLVEVEELTRICELNKKQNKKLRIGSKGAVKKLTSQWKEKNDAQFQAFQQIMPANVAKKQEESEIEIKDANEINAMTWQMVTMTMSGGNPYKSNDPRESKFWQKTVSSVLTDSQRDRFDKYRNKRDQAKQTARIQYALTSIHVELGLSEQQAIELDKLVRPNLEQAELNCSAMFEPYVMNYYASKADEQKVKTLLSSAQLQKWRIFIAPSMQIGPMMEMNK